MTPASSRKLFVNLPVRDLERSVAFFTRLGFSFDPKFTDESATCMVLSGEAFVMLLQEERFRDFTRRPICDTSAAGEAIFALTAASREEVDELVETALSAGGSAAENPTDHGFMYGWSFLDPDGHHWEVFWMDSDADFE